jgi:hypothetical protein
MGEGKKNERSGGGRLKGEVIEKERRGRWEG